MSNGNGSHENGADEVVVVERDVNVTGKAIEADLDALQAEIRAQTAGLEKCIEQLDTYQQVRLMVLGVIVALRECQFHLGDIRKVCLL